MDEDRSQERKRTWFIWGMVLAGVPSVALIIGLFHAFAGISEQKATGLAAVAGGIAEAWAGRSLQDMGYVPCSRRSPSVGADCCFPYMASPPGCFSSTCPVTEPVLDKP
ncbi:MAG: hypothetical protein DMG69_17305 [Acidobacteria bacterium]|nr:MAG: hypothetical protein DMG69_17305 [Acidobacteriota bacterium]